MHFFLVCDFHSIATWQPAPKINMQIIKNKTNLKCQQSPLVQDCLCLLRRGPRDLFHTL